MYNFAGDRSDLATKKILLTKLIFTWIYNYDQCEGLGRMS